MANEENVKGPSEDIELNDEVLEDVSGGTYDTNNNIIKDPTNVNVRGDD